MDYQQWASQWPAMANMNFGQPGSLGGANMFDGWNFTGSNAGASGLGGNLFAGGTPNLGSGSGLPAAAGGAGGFQLGMNMPTLQMGIGALGTLGNLWGAFNANKLAKDQFKFTKSVTNTNLNNSIQSYNTALSDRINARAVAQGMSDQERDNYIASNRLSRSS